LTWTRSTVQEESSSFVTNLFSIISAMFWLSHNLSSAVQLIYRKTSAMLCLDTADAHSSVTAKIYYDRTSSLDSHLRMTLSADDMFYESVNELIFEPHSQKLPATNGKM
jgi:hypothetical protein